MVINGKTFDLAKFSKAQLLQLDTAFEYFIFKEAHLFLKGEPFADSYKKDPKHFKQLLSIFITFKREMMAYFSKQYENRYNLVRQGGFKHAEDTSDDEDLYLYPDQWSTQDDELTKIIEKNTKLAYDLGIEALLLLGLYAATHTSDDKNAQKYLLENAAKISTDINVVTQKRIIAQTKASLDLGENREAFEKRLKKVFVNPYRGRFIAQDQALRNYLKGKDEAAKSETIEVKKIVKGKVVTENGKVVTETRPAYTKKTWVGVQDDRSEVCGQVLNDTVGINDTFKNGYDGPLAHFGCRCDLVYS